MAGMNDPAIQACEDFIREKKIDTANSRWRTTVPKPPKFAFDAKRSYFWNIETSQGPMPGEITQLEAPHTVVFHWWEKSRSGNLKFEGWPSYRLQRIDDNTTLVRHRGRLESYGVWRLGTPIWRRLAVKERTITLEALKASFES